MLRRQKQEGVSRKLVGFEVLDRAIARHGYDVYVENEKAGVVTSGTQTPYLKKTIGMAYVPSDLHGSGDRVSRLMSAAGGCAPQVVPLPFYKRAAPQTTS